MDQVLVAAHATVGGPIGTRALDCEIAQWK
jgi:hypothetical protein